MKITAIKQQLKRRDRYSVYVDSAYAFSLSESALLESKLASGQELARAKLEDYKKLSADDKLYNNALRYVAMRPRTLWEVTFYLERKQAPPPLIETILNKLSIVGLLDDEQFARAFVSDRRLLRPTSRRKIIAELKKKRVAEDIILRVVGEDNQTEREALQDVIRRKRRQPKYQDDLKLMQFLARQGFGYDDIKTALQQDRD